MVIKHKLSIDLQHAGSVQRIDAVQGDFNSRVLEISLYVDGAPWDLPGDTSAALRYCKPDGSAGIYDTLPDGAPAAAIDGNVVTITLAPAMLTAAGSVFTQLRLAQGGTVVATFTFVVNVLADPSCGTSAVEDYMRLSIEEQAKNAVETANSVRQDADAGKFNGNKIFDVTGAPAPDLGMTGDWAIDANTADLYCKDSPTTWEKKCNLRGPVGGSMPVDDGKTSTDNLWTAEKMASEIQKARKEAIDSCTLPFEQTAPVVQGHLVPGYPMQIVSHIALIQEGSGDPSPDNVRPIKGWTKLSMTVCGKNLIDCGWRGEKDANGMKLVANEDGSITCNGTASKQWAYYSTIVSRGLKAENLFFSGFNDAVRCQLTLRNKEGAFRYVDSRDSVINYPGYIIETLGVVVSAGVVAENLTIYPQLEVGSSKTEYGPYSGETYARQLSEEVFGGEFDWKSGELNIVTELVDAATLQWSLYPADNNRRANQFRSSFIKKLPLLCNAYKNSSEFPQPDKSIQVNKNFGVSINICDSRFNTVEGFVAHLKSLSDAGTPVMILINREPEVIRLKPEPGIFSRDGVTTSYSNSGDTTIIARADPNYISKIQDDRIATLEEKITQMMEVK